VDLIIDIQEEIPHPMRGIVDVTAKDAVKAFLPDLIANTKGNESLLSTHPQLPVPHHNFSEKCSRRQAHQQHPSSSIIFLGNGAGLLLLMSAHFPASTPSALL
jgi:hypothetical protein